MSKARTRRGESPRAWLSRPRPILWALSGLGLLTVASLWPGLGLLLILAVGSLALSLWLRRPGGRRWQGSETGTGYQDTWLVGPGSQAGGTSHSAHGHSLGGGLADGIANDWSGDSGAGDGGGGDSGGGDGGGGGDSGGSSD